MAIKIKKKDGSADPEAEADVAEDVPEGLPALGADADPFLKVSWDTASWVEENRQIVVGAILLVLVAIIGGYIGLEYLESQNVEASATLTPAFESYNTLIEGSAEMEAISANPDLDAPEKTYENDKKRWEDVYAAANVALSKHPNAEIATPAKLAKAAAAVKLGKNDEAIELYKEFKGATNDQTLKPIAVQGLATAYAAAEKWDEAIGALDELAGMGESYAGSVQYQKARILERSGKTDQAKELYHKVLDENPGHPDKSDIERRLANM